MLLMTQLNEPGTLFFFSQLRLQQIGPSKKAWEDVVMRKSLRVKPVDLLPLQCQDLWLFLHVLMTC